MFCHNCGSIVSDLASSCRHCGVHVQPVVRSGEDGAEAPAQATPPPAQATPPPAQATPPPAQATPPPVQPPPPPAPEATEAGRVYCRRCGAPAAELDRYCAECGTPLDESWEDPVARALNPTNGRSWVVSLLLCCVGFTGFNGLHRFYTGHVLIGVLQFITAGGCLIWTIIDLVLIAVDEYRDAEGRPLQK